MNFPIELNEWIENQKASENGCDMCGLQLFPPVPSVGRNVRGRKYQPESTERAA
jgi:hypothetical protein